MKTLIIVLMCVVIFCGNSEAVDLNKYKINPDDQVIVTLLSMVINDLEMCRATLKGQFIDNLLSIGHLNNAQSALKRSDLDPAYLPLVGEIYERIGKIKFYIVMNDLQNVSMRLSQLIAVLRAMIGAQTGGLGIYNNYPGGNVMPSYPPTTEIPVSNPVSPTGYPVNLNPVGN